jgi:hypothetical protein
MTHDQTASCSRAGRCAYPELRKLEPEDERGLEDKVEWQVVQNDAECKCFNEVERSEDGPIGQPLNVILDTRRFDGLEGEIGRKAPANQVGDGEGRSVDEDKEDCKDCDTENRGGLWNLGLLLELDESRVLGELMWRQWILRSWMWPNVLTSLSS